MVEENRIFSLDEGPFGGLMVSPRSGAESKQGRAVCFQIVDTLKSVEYVLRSGTGVVFPVTFSDIY